jgi:hypothetical protein
LAACASNAPDDNVAFEHVFDACTPLAIYAPAASDAQRASIVTAGELWAAVGVIAASDGDAGSGGVTILFEPSTPSSFGYYDDSASTIYVAEALADRERAIVIAHELGHAFGLIHVPVAERISVMNAGNLDADPTIADRDTVAARWTDCAAR